MFSHRPVQLLSFTSSSDASWEILLRETNQQTTAKHNLHNRWNVNKAHNGISTKLETFTVTSWLNWWSSIVRNGVEISQLNSFCSRLFHPNNWTIMSNLVSKSGKKWKLSLKQTSIYIMHTWLSNVNNSSVQRVHVNHWRKVLCTLTNENSSAVERKVQLPTWAKYLFKCTFLLIGTSTKFTCEKYYESPAISIDNMTTHVNLVST